MKKMFVIMALLVPSLVMGDDYLTVYISSQMTLTQRNTAKTYGRLAAKQAVTVTQLLQGPNTNYWSVIISTTTSVQNTFLNTLISQGKITQVSAFTVHDTGLVTQHFWNYPADYYKVWQSSQ